MTGMHVGWPWAWTLWEWVSGVGELLLFEAGPAAPPPALSPPTVVTPFAAQPALRITFQRVFGVHTSSGNNGR